MQAPRSCVAAAQLLRQVPNAGSMQACADGSCLHLQVFSSFLATADLGELQAGRPLPVRELWQAGQERRGLLWLLKSFLWQVGGHTG